MLARLKRVLMLVLSVLAGLYLAAGFFLYSQQRAIIFPGPKEGRAIPPNLERVDLPGGVLLALRRPTRADAPLIVHFHGNAEQLGDQGWLAWLVTQEGAGFAAVEYPGYGFLASQGEPSEAGIVAAAQAALAHLTGPLGIAKERVVLSGQSIGTGAAVEMARQGWGARLLLLTPYTSLPDLAARAVTWLPARWMVKDRFDSEAKAPQLTLPVLVIHGTRDEVIAYELGEQLSRRFPAARLLTIPGGHHNDLWERPEVREAATSFLWGR